MIKNLLIIAGIILVIPACKENNKKSASTSKEEVSVTANSQIDAEKLYGSWVEPNPADSKDLQGFTLKNDSTAESINTATLVSKKWWLKDKQLYLVQESMGNHTSSIDTTTFEIDKIDADTLILKSGKLSLQYIRKK